MIALTSIEYDIIRRIISGDLTPISTCSEEEQLVIRLLIEERRIILTSRNTYLVPVKTRRDCLEHKDELEQQEDQRAREDAKRASDRAHADQDRKLHFKHDWRIAFFEVFGGFVLGAVADHLFDIVGRAVELWLALSGVFGH